MTIEIYQFPLGMTMTNAYLVANPETGNAVVIDPGYDGEEILE